jgi:hypothetical protein
VVHGGELEPAEPLHPGHRMPGEQERIGDDADGGHPRPLKQDPVGDGRRSGYATTPIRQEYLSVAAPIYGRAGAVVAALSLILPITEPHGPRLAHLQATTRGISRALGTSQPRAARSAGRFDS